MYQNQQLEFCLCSLLRRRRQDSSPIVRVHLRPGEQVSETVIFVILHQEKANKVFGKRFSRDRSQTSSQLVFRQDPGALRPGVIFVGLIEVFCYR
jgi:hypothetical protein